MTRRRAHAAALVLLVAALGSAGAVGPASARAESGAFYSTYFGGQGTEMTLGSAVDSAGNLYLTGSTSSTDFPTTTNAAQRAYGGGDSDAFLAEFNSSGTLVYATYLGGTGGDEGRGVAVDSSGDVYVDGMTSSQNFPTINAPQSTFGGTQDAFVVKLSPQRALAFSTYLGGSGVDKGMAIAVDSAGAAYVAGETNSAMLPTTTGAFDTTSNGDFDAFIAKLRPDGSLAYSTYVGGPGYDDALAIAVDAAGNAFIAGKGSPGFPVTSGAFDTTQNGGYDMVVAKLNASGSALGYATYIGGSSWDEGLGIDVDASGDAYVAGNVQSPNFPTTANAFQRQFGGSVDTGVAKLNPTGSALVYSTLIGRSGWTEGDALRIDAAGDAYIAGHLQSPDYPTTSGAFQTRSAGGVDGFLAEVDQAGSSLLYSSYVGGSDWDGAMTFALDRSGNAYLSGGTWSSDFPVGSTPYQARLRGGADGFATAITTTTAQSPGADYTLSVSPASSQVVRGNAVAFTVSVVAQGGWSEHVSLTASNLPPYSSVTFSPPATTTSATLTIGTSANTPPGVYVIGINGASGGRVRTTSVSLTVHCCASSG